jgi:hypothetical protein
MKILSPIIVGVLALAASPAFATPSTDPHKVQVSVGYANTWDGYNQSNPFVPYPWNGGVDIFRGAPNTTAGGSCQSIPSGCYDAGAILLSNPSGNALHVVSVAVDIGGPFTTPGGWPFPAGIDIPPYGTMILTQTNGWDFETSNVNGSCTPNGVIPVVHVTVGNSTPVTLDFIDKTQVLNTGGYDKSGGACLHPDYSNNNYAEGHPFVALKTKDGSDN